MGLGYMSKASICNVEVLATGSSISPSYENIVSNGVRGAGYLYAGPAVFAWDYAKWEGTLDWDLGKEGSWGPVSSWAVKNRDTDQTISVEPGGCYNMSITGKNSSLSGSTSSGSLVSLQAGALAIGDSNNSIGGAGGSCNPSPDGGSKVWCGDDGLVAYWMTQATFGAGTCAIDWNFQINNSLVPVLCCAGESGTHYNPRTILLGPTTATASATFWEGSLPTDFWDREQSLTIDLHVGTVTVIGRITSTDVSIQTGESLVGAGITIEGIACDHPCVEVT